MRILAILLLATASSFGGAVEIGNFTKSGTTYQKVRMELVSADEIRVIHSDGMFAMPWSEADASIQFKLKPARAKILAAATPTPTPRPTPTETAAATRDLIRAYDANPIKADGVYKGRRVVIEGTVKRIDRDVLGRPYLDLGKITAYFTTEREAEVAELSKGSRVTIDGICDGASFGILSISDARVVRE